MVEGVAMVIIQDFIKTLPSRKALLILGSCRLIEISCYPYGITGHWSRTYRTEKQLVDLKAPCYA